MGHLVEVSVEGSSGNLTTKLLSGIEIPSSPVTRENGIDLEE